MCLPTGSRWNCLPERSKRLPLYMKGECVFGEAGPDVVLPFHLRIYDRNRVKRQGANLQIWLRTPSARKEFILLASNHGTGMLFNGEAVNPVDSDLLEDALLCEYRKVQAVGSEHRGRCDTYNTPFGRCIAQKQECANGDMRHRRFQDGTRALLFDERTQISQKEGRLRPCASRVTSRFFPRLAESPP